MEIEKIKGGTYYCPGNTNIGVYTFKNKNCLLIDTGINNTFARRLDGVLNENLLHVKYIVNTHGHVDHCGGNAYFQENYPGCEVYASEGEKLYMENPDLFSTILFSSPNNFKILNRLGKPFRVDYTLNEGINKINDEKFQVLYTPGHSTGHIGIITPEKVCFLGDCMFSEEILQKYKFPYLMDIEKSLDTLEHIKDVDADFFVLSHASRYIDKDEFLRLIDLNVGAISYFTDQILELLNQAMTKEELLENIIILNDLDPQFFEYHLNNASVSAFIYYLYKREDINYSIENGKLYFYKVEK